MGPLALEIMPLPGRAASSADTMGIARRIEPTVKILDVEQRTSGRMR